MLWASQGCVAAKQNDIELCLLISVFKYCELAPYMLQQQSTDVQTAKHNAEVVPALIVMLLKKVQLLGQRSAHLG